MQIKRQIEFLGASPDSATLEEFAATAARGYSISNGDVLGGSTNIAAPIFEVDGRPVAAVVVSAPSDRVTIADHARIGAMVSKTATHISRGPAPGLSVGAPAHA